MPGEAEEDLCLARPRKLLPGEAEENLSRQLWAAGVRVFSRPWKHKFHPSLKPISQYAVLQYIVECAQECIL